MLVIDKWYCSAIEVRFTFLVVELQTYPSLCSVLIAVCGLNCASGCNTNGAGKCDSCPPGYSLTSAFDCVRK